MHMQATDTMELSVFNILLHTKLSDILLAALAIFIFSSLVQNITNKGPMAWPLLGILPTLLFHFHHVYDWITDALIKSGGSFHYRGMIFTGTHGIITADPSHLEYMLKTRFSNFPKGKYFKERFLDLLGDGIFNADDQLWKDQRQATMSEMHSAQFLEYSFQTIQDLVHNKLLMVIEKLAQSSESVDFQDVLLRFTFDSICIAAFGVNPGCLDINLPHVPFAKAFEEAAETTTYRFIMPPFVWKPLKVFNIGSERKLRKALQIVDEFTRKMVTDRRNVRHPSNSDLLTRLVDSQKYQFSDKILQDICTSFVLAGRDTSSVALSWFFWLINEYPHVKNKILDELSSIVTARETPENIKKVVFTREELEDMVYLQAALAESLRLYPSVPVDFKEVVENDILPDGNVVKKGGRIMYVIYSMARIETIWGKDCREFKPERWIKGGRFVSANLFKYPVFNAGPRLCVGKKFAYIQMKMVVASILLRYNVNVVEGQKIIPKVTTTLFMKNGLLVNFEPRLSLKH